MGLGRGRSEGGRVRGKAGEDCIDSPNKQLVKCQLASPFQGHECEGDFAGHVYSKLLGMPVFAGLSFNVFTYS